MTELDMTKEESLQAEREFLLNKIEELQAKLSRYEQGVRVEGRVRDSK